MGVRPLWERGAYECHANECGCLLEYGAYERDASDGDTYKCGANGNVFL